MSCNQFRSIDVREGFERCANISPGDGRGGNEICAAKRDLTIESHRSIRTLQTALAKFTSNTIHVNYKTSHSLMTVWRDISMSYKRTNLKFA